MVYVLSRRKILFTYKRVLDVQSGTTSSVFPVAGEDIVAIDIDKVVFPCRVKPGFGHKKYIEVIDLYKSLDLIKVSREGSYVEMAHFESLVIEFEI